MNELPTTPPPSLARPAGFGRRSLLHGAIAAGLGGALASGLVGPSPAAATTIAVIDRTVYDDMLAVLTPRARPAHNESGSWAWGWAQVLMSYLPMYEAYLDTDYLDLFVADADRLLAARDSVRGVADYRGRSRGCWRSGNRYTTGSVSIPAGSGIIEIRNGRKGNASGLAGSVQIAAGTAPGLYSLTLTDVTGGRIDHVNDVSLDPTSANYLVSKLYWSSPNLTNTTAVDHRANHVTGDALPLGTFNLQSQWLDHLVDTGVLTSPLAWFVAIVRASPALTTAYGAKATIYETAVEDALACHEEDWVDGPNGTGWYQIPTDAPSLASGADWPHNQNLIVGLSWLYLARGAGTAAKRTAAAARATRILQYFKDDLTLSGTSYTWTYWCTSGLGYQGWTAADLVSDRLPAWGPYHATEDVSHAYLDVLAVLEARSQGLVFTATDMGRFASTFADLIATTDANGDPATTASVAGAGTLNSYGSRTGVWVGFTPWRPEIRPFLDDYFTLLALPAQTGYPPMSIAFLAADAAP